MDLMLKRPEAAELLDCASNHVAWLTRTGKLRAYQSNGQPRYRLSDVLKLATERSARPGKERSQH
jgi:hypothetical protein